MAGLRVVHTKAVEQNESLAEVPSAYGKIGLHAVWRTRLQIERGIQTQQVGDGVRDEFDSLRLNRPNRAIRLFQWNRLVDARDYHYLL